MANEGERLKLKVTAVPLNSLSWSKDNESVSDHALHQAFREFVFTAAAIVGALPSVGAGSRWGNHSFTYSVFLLCLCFRTTSLVMQCD